MFDNIIPYNPHLISFPIQMLLLWHPLASTWHPALQDAWASFDAWEPLQSWWPSDVAIAEAAAFSRREGFNLTARNVASGLIWGGSGNLRKPQNGELPNFCRSLSIDF